MARRQPQTGRGSCVGEHHPPPSYEVDTPRPSPRTNRTRRVPAIGPAIGERGLRPIRTSVIPPGG